MAPVPCTPSPVRCAPPALPRKPEPVCQQKVTADKLSYSMAQASLGASDAKSLTVTIQDKVMETLKTANYVLCIAKKVKDDYTVVWSGIKELLPTNTLTWTPEYELFGTNTFKDGFTVTATTKYQPIQGNQTCVLDAAGILGSASGSPDSEKPFYMDNQMGSVHPGVRMLLNGESLPIYVAQEVAIKGEASLQPKEYIKVWFTEKVETSTMISEIKGNNIELNYTGVNSHSVTYTDDQEWTQNSFDAGTMLYLPNGDLSRPEVVDGTLDFLVQFTPVITTAIGAALIAYLTTFLAGEGVVPETVQYANGVLNITFAHRNLMESIHKDGTITDYRAAIEKGLKSAQTVEKLPENETWCIKKQ